MVLVGSGGLGREVNGLLRTLTLPGAEQLFPVVCSPKLRDAGERFAAWLAGRGLRAAPVVEEIWRSYASLAEAPTRRAFFRTLRAVIDSEGQSVNAADRLHLTSQVPTLIVWGGCDAIIPVRHAHAAHDAIENSRLEIFEDAGHYPHCEDPGRFAELLTEFIDSTTAARHCERRWEDLLRTGQMTTPQAAAGAAVA
ncbi:MAG: alpha/beta fold hydrolase [Myxococcales bacterium]|nr:MAG: alpha/beta fold hydrolase [Myxococcales bacterium]